MDSPTSSDRAATIAKVVALLYSLCEEPQSVLFLGDHAQAWRTELDRLLQPTIFSSQLACNSISDTVDILVDACQNPKPPIPLATKFDLVICIGTPAHVAENYSFDLVKKLTSCSDLICFASSHPGDLGHMNINCQPPLYWAEKFEFFDFRIHDILRPQLISDVSLDWWYRQNLFLYSRKGSRLDDQLLSANASAIVPLEFCLIHHTTTTNLSLSRFNQTKPYTLSSLLGKIPEAIKHSVRHRLKIFSYWSSNL